MTFPLRTVELDDRVRDDAPGLAADVEARDSAARADLGTILRRAVEQAAALRGSNK